MRRRIVLASFLGLLLILPGSNVPAQSKKGSNPSANDGVITNWGQPKGFAPGKVVSYWIWYNDGVWHFRTTGGGSGKTHHFQGTIEVGGGRLIGLKGKKGEYGGKNVDRFIFNPTLTAIAFDFKTAEGVDGLNFAVAPGTPALKFTLAIDGKAMPQHIRVGKAGDHPATAVFTAPGTPPDPPNPPKKKK